MGLGIVCAVLLLGQTEYFSEDFECSDSNSFGDPAGIYEWDASSSDPWRTDLGTGVSPVTDENVGTFGSPVDDYENFLLTGHASWTDIVIEADMTNTDNDAMGLVVRYSSADSYYACYMTKHQAAVCQEPEGVGVRFALIRVDTSQVCANDYMVDGPATFSYAAATTYRMRLSVIGDTVDCAIDADFDGAFGTAGDHTLQYVDPAPLPSGLAGIYNFDNGEQAGQVVFDNVTIMGYDPDTDGDGLPDAVELDIGTNPNSPDSDFDGISDLHEAGMPQYPPDVDADNDTDAVDRDSDGDGIPDRVEGGDNSITTTPVDTDCDGIPDFRDQDSDGDGTSDADDNCPTVAGAQTDGDSDGVGDLCDVDTADPNSCGDRDYDGCDDCSSGTYDLLNDGTDSDNDGICDGKGGGPPLGLDQNGDGFADNLVIGGGGVACNGGGGDPSLLLVLVFALVGLLRRP